MIEFFKIKGETNSPILSISITDPIPAKEYTYYYPDGITKGLLKKDTYFITESSLNSCVEDSIEYYKTPQEAIENKHDSFCYFVDPSGKIMKKGFVSIRVDFIEDKIKFFYETTEELSTFLYNLVAKHSINLETFVCLTDKETTTLYEYNINLSQSTKI